MAKNAGNTRGRSSRRGLRGRSAEVADWGQVDAAKLVRAIERASFTGGAIRFGYSRDGGAYAVGLYGDGEPYTEFLPPSGDLDGFLDDIIQLYEDIADEQASTRRAKKTATDSEELP